MHVIVDTNVLIVANKEAHQASPQCVLNCINRLKDITTKGQILVIDDNWRILNEYKKKVSPLGQPGVGDYFLKWVLVNMRNSKHCEQVFINEVSDNQFAEFPTDPALEKFDPSDRKFVAVALAHPAHPPITNAVDADWCHYHSAFKANGLQIDFLCPEDLSGCSISMPPPSP